MIKDLYNFSKNAWHVKLFKWVYNTDPTKTFNTMCPYFWSLVGTILFLPLILIVKLFGKGGTKFLSNLESYKRRKQERLEDNLIKACSKENMSDKEAYELYNSKCYDEYRFLIDYDIRESLYEKQRRYIVEVLTPKKEAKKLRKARATEVYAEVRDTKAFAILSYFITGLVGFVILHTIYRLCISFSASYSIDWKSLGSAVGVIIIIASVASLALCVYGYIIVPLSKYLSCKECTLCKWKIWSYIGNFLLGIIKFFCIIAEMIYLTYKKACPRVTWKD